jgi:hypothetical protein
MVKEIDNSQSSLHIASKDDLKNILINHSLWLNSEEKEGERANLAGYNLRIIG